MLALLLALCIDEAEVAALPAHEVCVAQLAYAVTDAENARWDCGQFPTWHHREVKELCERRLEFWTILDDLTGVQPTQTHVSEYIEGGGWMNTVIWNDCGVIGRDTFSASAPFGTNEQSGRSGTGGLSSAAARFVARRL